jgi:hypothetical protein
MYYLYENELLLNFCTSVNNAAQMFHTLACILLRSVTLGLGNRAYLPGFLSLGFRNFIGLWFVNAIFESPKQI